MERGDYMTFSVNWETNEMTLVELSPVLQNFCKHGRREPIPITPIVHTIECLSKTGPKTKLPYRCRIDATYDQEQIHVHLHCTNDFASVVDVPFERLKKVLDALLTPRELEVATLLFYGRTIRCIAGTLHITEGTVKRIIYNIYQKLGVGSQVELIQEIYARLAQYYAVSA